MTKLISVIMPCYNSSTYLAEAIESVLNQTYPFFELIIIDDGSTDNSIDILRKYKDKIIIVKQTNLGPYPARNKGIEVSKGEYLAFLDSDDYWHSECLEKLYFALEKSKSVIAYCGWQNVGFKLGDGKPYVPPDYEIENKLELFLKAAAPWPIHAALIKRNVVLEAGGFDLSWPTCMDYDLWLRIGILNPVTRVGEVLAFYRHHDKGQITSKQWRQAITVWLIKKKFIENNPKLVSEIEPSKLRILVDGALIKRGYDNYWKRDLDSAHSIFRKVLFNTRWFARDIRYLLPTLLPKSIYKKIITFMDSKRPL